MENASKALIMAGGVFLAIIILAIGVSLFLTYRNVAEKYDEKLTMYEIAEMNKEFEKYLGLDINGKITVQEAVTAARTAKVYNEKYGAGTIIVYINSTRFDNKNNEDFADKINYIMKNSPNKRYKIIIESYYETTSKYPGLVKKIKFNFS